MFDTASILQILMWPAIILVVIGVVVAVAAVMFAKQQGSVEKEKEKPKFQYTARKFFMTGAERDFYNLLGQAVGAEYRIFAQVHLDALLDEKIPGQNYKAARAHISQKSVDFLLCDKDDLRPILAIELDDSSHERPDRVTRDGVVESVLASAGLRLLRIPNAGSYTPAEIAQKVAESLNP